MGRGAANAIRGVSGAMSMGGASGRGGTAAPTAQGSTRRRLLGVGMAGVLIGASASGGVLAACGISGGPGGSSAESRPTSRAPVTIEILTRAGVAAQTGHSQWYAQVATTSFTPQTGITVVLFDGDPD